MAIAKRKKRFFDVDIPLIKKETQLQAYELSELEGRTIKYDLTRILRGKSIMLKLKVVVDKDGAKAIPIGARLVQYALRRMVRKGTDYVEDSFLISCKDAKLRIKPLLVTRRRVSKAVMNALRQKAKEELTKYAKDKKSEDIFDDLLKNQIQKPLSLILKKIYPLSACEIRVLEIEK